MTQLAAQNPGKLPFPDAKEEIEKLLTSQRVDNAVDRWLGQARTQRPYPVCAGGIPVSRPLKWMLWTIGVATALVFEHCGSADRAECLVPSRFGYG